MVKKIAILAVALFWLFGTESLPSPSAPPQRSSKPSLQSSPLTRVARKAVKTQHKRVRRRKRKRNPWRVSSFGEPTAEDNPAGENPVVRQAAVEALGIWNGSIVVVEPNTGRILSIVNQKLALESAFTPCSTFKPVVALAGLKEGIITLGTELRVGRRTRMNVTEAMAHSNNRFFARLGERLGFRRVAQYARQFGIGQKAGWKIPGESPGRFPSAPTRAGGVGLLSSYGESIEVTPLQMAAVTSAIANGGTLYYLQYPRTPEELARFRPKVRRRLTGLARYLPQVNEGLAAAVIYGTGRMAYNPEENIYGKTGTCSDNRARLGWFVSFAGQRQPKYVVVVLLRGGRPMFGPHAAEIAGRLYRELRMREYDATQASHATPPSGLSER